MMTLLGKANWLLPGRLDRLQPHLGAGAGKEIHAGASEIEEHHRSGNPRRTGSAVTPTTATTTVCLAGQTAPNSRCATVQRRFPGMPQPDRLLVRSSRSDASR
jgi:hypothetical protein